MKLISEENRSLLFAAAKYDPTIEFDDASDSFGYKRLCGRYERWDIVQKKITSATLGDDAYNKLSEYEQWLFYIKDDIQDIIEKELLVLYMRLSQSAKEAIKGTALLYRLQQDTNEWLRGIEI